MQKRRDIFANKLERKSKNGLWDYICYSAVEKKQDLGLNSRKKTKIQMTINWHVYEKDIYTVYTTVILVLLLFSIQYARLEKFIQIQNVAKQETETSCLEFVRKCKQKKDRYRSFKNTKQKQLSG